MSPMLPLLVLLLLPSLPLVTCDDDVTVQSLMTLVQHQAASIQTLQSRMTNVEYSAQQALATERQHTGQIAAITSRINTKVYFNSYMMGGQVDIGTSNGPIQFYHTISNEGNGYNRWTGVFTAPVSGMYVMYVQMMKEGNQGSVHYAIEKPGTVLCLNGVDSADWDKSSCLATVHLYRGETVYVRRHSGGQRIEGTYSYFSGFLVSADA